MKTVSVILNGYKRNHTLREQVEAVENQTHKVDSIMYWQNTSQPRYDLSPLEDGGHDVAVSN